VQVDYGEGAPTRVPGTDKYRRPRLFVATLRYSRASFRCVVWKSGQQAWAELHEQAFRYFRRLSAVRGARQPQGRVLKPDLYEPELNPVYAATLRHYGVVADPARVRDPNRKGTVENAIGHTQATALKGKRFDAHPGAERIAGALGEELGGQTHSRHRAAPGAGHARRRTHPTSRPCRRWACSTSSRSSGTVCDDSCVRIDHSSYAARPAAIGSKVLVRIFAARIEIRDMSSGTLLRCHAKAERPGSGSAALAGAGVQPFARDAPDLAPGPGTSARKPAGCAS